MPCVQVVFALGFLVVVGVGVVTKLGYFKRFEDDREKSTSIMGPPGHRHEMI